MDVVNRALPPAYINTGELYKNEKLLGLVGLYNPNKNATVECHFIRCLVTTTTTKKPPSTLQLFDLETEKSPGGLGASNAPEARGAGMVEKPNDGIEALGEMGTVLLSPSDGVAAIAGNGALTETFSNTIKEPPSGAAAAIAGNGAPTDPSSNIMKEFLSDGAAAIAGDGAPTDPSSNKVKESFSLPEAEGKMRRLSFMGITYNALLCITTPPVLIENQQPFEYVLLLMHLLLIIHFCIFVS